MIPHPANAPTPEQDREEARLFSFKLWYGFYFAAHYTQLFLPLIFNKVMLFSPAIIGSLTASRRFATFLVAPLFAWLCDATLQHRSLLAAGHTLYYIASLSLCFLRSVPSVFIVVLLRDAFISGCEPTIDNAALATLDDIAERRGENPLRSQTSRTGYGSLRLWGSVGWGLASYGGGLLVDHVFHSNLLYILYIHVLLGVIVVSIILFVIDLSPSLFHRQTQRKITTTSSVGDFPLASPRATFTAVCALGQGIVLGTLQLTSFIYFSGLGVSTAALGLSVMLSCVAEGTVFRLEKKLSSFAGPMTSMRLSLCTSGTMLVFFSLIRLAPVATPWFVLCSVLNGGSYALFRMSALAVINEIAPPGLASTAQGTLQSLSMGIGPAIGSFVAGMAYQSVGVPSLFVGIAMMQFLLSMLPFLMDMDAGGGRGRVVTSVMMDESVRLMQQVVVSEGRTQTRTQTPTAPLTRS